MKSTKVQNPRRIASRLVNYANARARKLATPRVVAVTRGAVSSRSNKGQRLRFGQVRWPRSTFAFCISRFAFLVSRFAFLAEKYIRVLHSRFAFCIFHFPFHVSRFPFPVSNFPFRVFNLSFLLAVLRFPFSVSRLPRSSPFDPTVLLAREQGGPAPA